ncbi:MAG TPA: BON domain-containing protein, partial [Actinomycetota bacterium]|nr:BON domain-containing protein [Actinomycetota bacterium]
IHVDNGVVVLQGRVERRSLLPYVLRAVHGVEGVVQVENRLAYDIDDVIVGEFTMDPNRFFIHVDDGVVVLQGRVERHSLLPYLFRAVHGVEGVVRVENRLSFDLDDEDTLLRALAYR